MEPVNAAPGATTSAFAPDQWLPQIANGLGTFSLALIASVLLLWPSRSLLRRWGVVDIPNARSSHARTTVRGLGIAVLIAWAIAVVIAAEPPFGFLTGIGAIVLIGAVDDVRSLSPRLRLGAQVLVSLGIAWVLVGEVRPALPVVIAVIVIGVFLTATINAVNFMDGVNGMSALHAVVFGCVYFVILVSFVRVDSPWMPTAAALAGAFAAFLPFNVRKVALGFLGDAGSYGLGVIVGSLAVVTWAVTGSWIAALFPLAIYGLDTAITAARRITSGHNLLNPHRDHIYQRTALRTGLPLLSATITTMATLVMGLIAVLFAYGVINVATALIVGAGIAVIYLFSPALIGTMCTPSSHARLIESTEVG